MKKGRHAVTTLNRFSAVSTLGNGAGQATIQAVLG
jgi:hypothetical protein